MTTQRSAVSGQRSARDSTPLAPGSAGGSDAHLARRAFSLVEMMVVIGIIVVLMGLLTGVAIALHAKNDIRQAEAVINKMDSAYKQWQNTSQRQITFGVPGNHGHVYDIDESIYTGGLAWPPLQHVFLKIVMQDPEASKILAQISTQYFKRDHNDNYRVVDPWEQEIKIIFPGRPWEDGDLGQFQKDIDGTIRTDDEEILGACDNRRICFASGGPDGKLMPGPPDPFNPAPPGPPKELADNLYSHALLKP